MQSNFIDAIKLRRTIYHLNNQSTISDQQLIDQIQAITQTVPSPFNIQSGRVVILLGGNHHTFWNIVLETLRKIVPEASFPQTEAKIQSFEAGYGTILFFDNTPSVEDLKAKFPLYKQHFDSWADHANGMLQFAIWTYLAEQNMGASLQHYNPLIDDEVKKTFNLPLEWRLVAQMPFGSITKPAGEKSFLPIEERVRVYK
ncbi:MAG: nitroreductase family protein [Bacilli bacterium]|jgi:predicted oxidoreductase (fatty acid repression mutant protein)|nr:nitroreductase family protein [Bacilli bacterium]HHU24709.1 nitroreductase family protein [Acholeplasmataceae bacterium]